METLVVSGSECSLARIYIALGFFFELIFLKNNYYLILNRLKIEFCDFFLEDDRGLMNQAIYSEYQPGL